MVDVRVRLGAMVLVIVASCGPGSGLRPINATGDTDIVVAADGAAADDLWIIRRDRVEHWNGRELRRVPHGRVNVFELQFNPLTTTPQRLWLADPDDGVVALHADGTREVFRDRAPPGLTGWRLHGGDDQHVWAEVGPDRLVDLETGASFSVPGGPGVAVVVLGEKDVWNLSLDGTQQSHWDGARVTTSAVSTPQVGGFPVFAGNGRGEAWAPLSGPDAGESMAGERYANDGGYLQVGPAGFSALGAAPPGGWRASGASYRSTRIGVWSDGWRQGFVGVRERRVDGVRRADLVLNAWDGTSTGNDRDLVSLDDDCEDSYGTCDQASFIAGLGSGGVAAVLFRTRSDADSYTQVWAGDL